MSKTFDIRTAQRLSSFFKVFGDDTRIRIVEALSHEELCVNEICEKLNMSKSAVSHQLSILRKEYLVKYRKEGKSVFYSLDDDHVKAVFEMGLEHIQHR